MTKVMSAVMMWCLSAGVMAEPSQALMQELNSKVLRIQVGLANGSYGLGSGVVVAENQVVTNCHVVAKATSVNVVSEGASYNVVGIKPDWRHDVCVLQMQDLPIKPVAIKSSRELKYEQPVINIGYPSFVPMPVSAQGVVKGLFTLDDSVIVRTTASFRMGASGGGLFDNEGALVGLITLKSPGRNAYYYYMSVDWVQALLEQKAGPVVVKSELPFWAKPADQWPFFMKVVYPYLNKEWGDLKTIAQQWVKQEPDNSEAWYHLAAAEYETHQLALAEQHLHRVVSLNHEHSQAFYYLGLIAGNNGNQNQADAEVAHLKELDAEAAERLQLALKALP